MPPQQQLEIPELPFNQHTLFVKPTNETEVLQIIYSLKNKAGGSDNIHASMLKLAALYIAHHLAEIVNNTFLREYAQNNLKQLTFVLYSRMNQRNK